MAKYNYTLSNDGSYVLKGTTEPFVVTEQMIRGSKPEKQQITNAPVLHEDFLSLLAEDNNLNLVTDSEFAAIVNSK